MLVGGIRVTADYQEQEVRGSSSRETFVGDVYLPLGAGWEGRRETGED